MSPTDEYKKLQAKRKTYISKITDLRNLISKAKTDNTLFGEVQARFQDFKDIYECFSEVHNDIIMIIDDKEFNTEDVIRKDTEKFYYETVSIYNNLFPSDSTINQNVPSPRNPLLFESNVKLPKISIPIFKGDTKFWPTFFDLFKKLIHENRRLGDVEKLQYLFQFLEDEPLKLLSGISITDDNYQVAFDKLVKRYQNKRLLASNALSSIMSSNLKNDSAKELRQLLNTFSESLAILNSLNFNTNNWDFILFYILLEKIDASTRTDFEVKHSHIDIPTYVQLSNFLESRCKALESVQHLSAYKSNKYANSNFTPKTSNFHKTNNKPSTSSFSFNTRALPSSSITCYYCKELHVLSKCPRFLEKSVFDRNSYVKQNKLCSNCLHHSHSLQNCSSNYRCRVCKNKHHSVLHIPRTSDMNTIAPLATPPQIESQTTNQVSEQNTSASLTVQQFTGNTFSKTSTVLLATAIAEIRDGMGNFQTIRVLLDPGSQCNFISEKCLRRLGLPRRSFSTSISGLNQMSSFSSKGLTNCFLKPTASQNPTFNFDAIVVPQLCSNMPQFDVQIGDWNHIEGLQLADKNYFLSGPIDLLIGAELFTSLLLGGKRDGGPGQPSAIETVFGWVLLGKLSTSHQNSFQTFFVNTDVPLDVSLTKFWEIEQVPTKTYCSPEDAKCEEMFKNTTTRDSSGRFVVHLPFKHNFPDIGDTYAQAFRRFTLLESRLLKNPTLYSAYSDFMKDYVDSGHMSKVPLNTPKPPISCFLPHHCVIKPESVSTKLRVVWDGSARGSKGISLNDTLYSGPKLQKDIFSLLLVFRFHPIVFIADIKQMFRQVLINPEHRHFQKILWRFSPNDSLSEWTLNTVTFGLSSSPYLAMRVIQELADLEKDRFPEASKILKSQMYIDDILGTCPSVASALALQQELIGLLMLGGFELRKWASNSEEILSAVPSTDRQMPLSFDKEEPHFLKVLGLQWQPFSDTFSYQFQQDEKPCTKRNILSKIGKIFDPLGFLSPVILSAKILMQKLWVANNTWDETPAKEIVDSWTHIESEFSEFSNIQLPRRIVVENYSRCELHGFSDASNRGYGAVIYFRVESAEQISVSLVCAKSRVAPLKSLSLPRLELCGAKLLSDLIEVVKDTYANQITFDEVFAWCDSQVVLSWLAGSPSRWETFVANRVSYIQDKVPTSSWHYVPTALNAADCASRGLSPSALLSYDLWWKGPDFLSLSREDWYSSAFLKPPLKSYEIPEEKKVVLTVELREDHILDTLLEKHSSLSKIQRILSYCFRVSTNLKSSNRIFGHPSPDELHRALMCLIKHVQYSVFTVIISKITQNLLLPKPFRKLALFLDTDGFLRAGGRLKNSDLEFSVKYPLLLPSSHRFTTLIIEFTHLKYCHPGFKTLHNLLIQQFWILSARRAIQKTLSNCFRCFKVRPKFYTPPIMGDLPNHRISQVKPFSYVAIDFCGPFHISLYKMRGAKMFKSYVCVFVCTSTKAIHLELTQELSTDSFIAAFRRFIARRGNIISCFSDNGTNFVGAYNQFQEYARLASEKLNFRWQFSPPSGPHFNGLAEAGVKGVKTHLLRVVGDQRLTYEEFSTLLCQIEGILNSRPLTSQSSDVNDLIPLTPSHFLTLEPMNCTIPNVDFSDVAVNRLSRWQLIQRLHSDFWKRYYKEYLNTLQQRQKWLKSGQEVKINDLVLISNNNVPPLNWPIGRVIELHPGDDSRVRVATIKTANGQYRRPVVKLCPLPKN